MNDLSQNFTQGYRNALEDFHNARRQATMKNILARIQGKNYDLLSFDDIRKQFRAELTNSHQKLQEIPLDAIVGSVNRYEDFTRDFLPKSRVEAQRWARVELVAAGQEGLPPIEVYQLGKAYFVIDGNHRVSVARSFGAKTIQAYVNEIKTRVDLDPNDSPQDIIIKAELTNFLQETRLDILRPDSDFSVTAPEAYGRLLEHIAVHQYFLGIDQQRDVFRDEAITHWHDSYYLPTIEIIQNFGLTRDFPGKTNTDIFLWLCDYRVNLEKYLEEPVDEINAARHYVSQQNSDADLQEGTQESTSLGELRRQKLLIRQEGCLFSDILVPINGKETSWVAASQALEISKRENSRLHGLHVVADDTQKSSSEAVDIQAQFNQLCEEAKVDGKLTIASGSVSSQISERVGINDLIVVNLAYPPEATAFSRLTNGFRTLVQRSPRPVLACPEAFSSLNHAVLAYSGSKTSQEALYISAYLAGKWNIKLTVLSISPTDKNPSTSGEMALSYLHDHLIDADLIAKTGPVVSGILDSANQVGADFIIMGGYSSSALFSFLFDTVADQILRESSIPMLLCR